ncbi:hypothetical protein Plhal304r1_c029g0095911 [Plasmopara halstedii]
MISSRVCSWDNATRKLVFRKNAIGTIMSDSTYRSYKAVICYGNVLLRRARSIVITSPCKQE